eukprot:3909645-Pleurochrysis_carterae.AAC.1
MAACARACVRVRVCARSLVSVRSRVCAPRRGRAIGKQSKVFFGRSRDKAFAVFGENGPRSGENKGKAGANVDEREEGETAKRTGKDSGKGREEIQRLRKDPDRARR